MPELTRFWSALSGSAKAGLAAGVFFVLLATSVAGWWLLRTDYQVLFADLKPQDAHAMTTELDRLKIPYRLGEEGTAILVDKNTVHSTRLKLMGKNLPLQGAVGFELFNNTDFGMTEFAQKINYQRALQGEITRTIQSLAEVRDVRVLLAMPEQGLFKQATSKAKASITLDLKPGRALRAEQVSGIQRLVAASVPGMTVQDVTLVDHQGVALTRSVGENEPEDTGAKLDLKRDTEGYLARKATAVLDRAFGAGVSLASVDVTLNTDQIKITTEDVLPASGSGTGAAVGVMVRERESARDSAAPLDARMPGGRSGTSQREVDYAVGRRVEQVVSQPGSIRRISVVAVVKQPLDLTQQEQARKMVAAAVGASLERGDTIVLHAQAGGTVTEAPTATGTAANDGGTTVSTKAVTQAAPSAATTNSSALQGRAIMGMLALLSVVAAALVLVRHRRPGSRNTALPEPSRLTPQERAAALQKVKTWLAEPTR